MSKSLTTSIFQHRFSECFGALPLLCDIFDLEAYDHHPHLAGASAGRSRRSAFDEGAALGHRPAPHVARRRGGAQRPGEGHRWATFRLRGPVMLWSEVVSCGLMWSACQAHFFMQGRMEGEVLTCDLMSVDVSCQGIHLFSESTLRCLNVIDLLISIGFSRGSLLGFAMLCLMQ